MRDQAGRADRARRMVRVENQANVVMDIKMDVDGRESDSRSSIGEVVEQVVWVPCGRAQLNRVICR